MEKYPRLAILTPHFPPQKGGVSDYSLKWANVLARNNHSTCVVTASHTDPSDKFKIFHYPQPWNLEIYQKIQNDLEAWNTDILIIEYTPHAFAPHSYGIHFSLPIWLKKLNTKSKIKIFCMIHEARYPLQLNPKGILIGVPHLIQFISLCYHSNWLGFSHHKMQLDWTRRLKLSSNSITLPIFSNITKHSPPKNRNQFVASFKVPTNQKILLYFGGAHPTNLFTHIAETKRTIHNACLVLIGLNENQRKKIPELRDLNNVYALGYLPEEKVSQWLQIADMLLAPFMDGVTTRRSTVHASLLHEIPLITTFDYCSTKDVPWSEIAWLSDQNTARHFANAAKEALEKPTECKKKSTLGLKYYQQNFSIEATYDKFINFINSPACS